MTLARRAQASTHHASPLAVRGSALLCSVLVAACASGESPSFGDAGGFEAGGFEAGDRHDAGPAPDGMVVLGGQDSGHGDDVSVGAGFDGGDATPGFDGSDAMLGRDSGDAMLGLDGTPGSDAMDATVGHDAGADAPPDAGDAARPPEASVDAGGACSLPSDCPAPANACVTATCTAHACGTAFVAAGTDTPTQTAGDCQVSQCDGAGNVTSVPNDADLPASSNGCTLPTCTAGVPSTPPAPAGAACGLNGVCDGSGVCAGCTLAAECPGTDSDCATRTCTTGSCGLSFAPSGTVTTTQTAGDCRENTCDGAGNVTSAIDDTDVPASPSTCLAGACALGVPSTANAAPGTTCSENGGILCDGQGACTQTITVLRIAGAAALSSAATPVALDTYYPLAASTPASSVALPTIATGLEQPLLLGGTSTTEGGLSRSGDGHYLTLSGYAVAAGGTTTAAGVPRVVGRVDAAGAVDTTTVLPATAFAGASVRGSASVDGSGFWVGGTSSSSTAGGVWYVPLGAAGGAAGPGTQVVSSPNNLRQVAVYEGALYGDSGSGAFTGVLSFGGLPTAAGATATLLPGMATPNPGGFTLLDQDPTVAGVDTLYVADSGATAGLERWTFDGATWTKDATFTVLTSGCLGVAGWSTGTGVVLVVSTSTGALQRIDVPTTGTPTATLVATAAVDSAFRGVALAPH